MSEDKEQVTGDRGQVTAETAKTQPEPETVLVTEALGKAIADHRETGKTVLELVKPNEATQPRAAAVPSSSVPPGMKAGDPNVSAPEQTAKTPPGAAVPHESSGPTQPSRNEDTHDSLGNPKGEFELDEKGKPQFDKLKEQELLHGTGPRGVGCPPEHLKEIDRRDLAAAHEKKLKAGMSSTDQVDSIGKPQHIYEHEPQGYDRSGARLPDRNTGKIIETAPKHVGPRGTGAPKDTFHK